jgi:light-regulated signal transduction histidine kinase (bacteriophytochrome)
LQKAEQKFRSLFEAAPDAMVMCRENGEILMVNSQTENLFGCSRDRLHARNMREIVPDWSGPGHSGFQLYATRSDGSRFPVEISFSPLQTEDGTVITSAIRDISERRKNEEQIHELNVSLEARVLERTKALLRSNEELEQFAYIASHDLQEPLRTVSIFAQLMAKTYRGQLDEEAEQFIDFIVEGSERMSKLIHELLDFSRIDARGRDFFSRTSCNSALEDAIRNIQPLIEENGAEIISEDLPSVISDSAQLTRLFQNLLLNSIRYRTDEPPRIEIRAEADGPEWRFSVKDNGIGIDPQYAEKIFGIFKYLHSRDKYSGTGMGLAICRQIVGRHEGRIWVESALGKGATFYFTLPRIE